MATIVTRAGKGAPLTHNEVDANFTNLNTDKLESGSTAASLTITSADINGGTIDGTVIGGSTPAAISGTTGTFSGNLTVDTNTLFVDAANNRVGMGTATPNRKLEISETGSGEVVLSRQMGIDGADFHWLETSVSPTSNMVTFKSTGASNGGFTFNDASKEFMRLDASGNFLLVGTTATTGLSTDGFRFRTGSIAYAEFVRTNASDSSANIYISRANNGAVLLFYRNDVAATVGSVSVTSSATAYNTSSDYRLKEDVQPMVGSVDRLMALKPVNFAWKVDGSRVDGFLAHEAQEVVPEAVTGSKDAVDKDGKPEYQGIDQSKLVPLLTAALQEALTEIADLKARVAALEA
jgi:hypothetical protein